MKALILNSGIGSRMAPLTDHQPKCLTEISPGTTILSRQLQMLAATGIVEVVITTGPFPSVLEEYCKGLKLPLQYTFVQNPDYQKTNYIYSIYLARSELMDDILLLHGDLVFEQEVLWRALENPLSCMAVSSTAPLPEKDFKALISENRIKKVGIEFFDSALAAQPLYRLTKDDWLVWLKKIAQLCESGQTGCYAERALNEITGNISLYPMDIRSMLCGEVDCPEDLAVMSMQVRKTENRTVYMCFSSDVLHGGHMSILKRAASLGRLTVGVLSDRAVSSYKRFPLLPCRERKVLLSNIKGVEQVIEQAELSYRKTLLALKPDIVVHGDDWREGFQKPLREEVLDVLTSYGGKLVEFPYSNDAGYREVEGRFRTELSLPDHRRGRLRKLLDMKGLITAMEAHDGLSGLIVENTVVHEQGKTYAFDAIWVSSLCDSTARGKPDIELVDKTSRFRTIDDLTEVTTKPIIFDGDTGGLTEHFAYTVRTLEKLGVSAVIIEDKCGLKKNSLFGLEEAQTQDTIENFSAKISAGKRAQKSLDFMIIARIESLILEQGMEDALMRASAFVQAGADGIMIHSRRKTPDEIFEFVEQFRKCDKNTPLVVVPTSFHTVTEAELERCGVNIVIYANQLMRSQVPAMRRTAETILKNHRALEADRDLLPFQDIIRMIPAEL